MHDIRTKHMQQQSSLLESKQEHLFYDIPEFFYENQSNASSTELWKKIQSSIFLDENITSKPVVKTTHQIQCIEFQADIEDEFQIKTFLRKVLWADILIGFQIVIFVQYVS